MRRLAHRQPGKVGRIHGVRDLLLFEQTEVRGHLRARKPVPRFADRDAAQHPRRKPPAARPRPRSAPERRLAAGRGFGSANSSAGSVQPVDRRRLARHAVVVHRVHAVGGDVHLVERAVPVAERKMPSTAIPRRVRSSASCASSTGSPGKYARKPFRQYLHC